MKTEFENGQENLSDETRQKLKHLSKALLYLHKTLLDGAKAEYETKYGEIAGINQYLQLVIDDEHFAWLRKISSLISLIDEAVSIRRPASETEARALLEEARILLNFEDEDKAFNDNFRTVLQKNLDAVINYRSALELVISATDSFSPSS